MQFMKWFNLSLLIVITLEQIPGGGDAMAKMSYQAQQKAAEAQAIAQAAAMGVPITIKPNTPPPPPEMESEGTEPSPSSYDDLFTYSGYFDPYQDDVHAFMINGKRRKRHRVNCGRDRKGRHCDFRRSHHQHSFYNKECIHYAGDLEIYGVWQCGSRQHLSQGAIVRLMVELHELILKYKQDKNDYVMERLERVMEYNNNIYKEFKKAFRESARDSLQRMVDVLDRTNQQIFENFRNLMEMSKDIFKNLLFDRETELEELKYQLAAMVAEFPPPESICDNLRDCELCSSRDGCIWCNEEQSCFAGNEQDGANFFACDIWVRNGNCPEDEPDYDMMRKQRTKIEYFYNQPDLELDQKMYFASKQREMIQLKNQIDNRRKVFNQLNSMVLSLRNRNIKVMEEYMKKKQYEGDFLEYIAEEDAQGGFDQLKQNYEEMLQAEEEEKAMTIAEKKKTLKLKKQEEEKKEKEQFKKRHEAIPIDKSKFKDKVTVADIMDADKKKDEDEGEEK